MSQLSIATTRLNKAQVKNIGIIITLFLMLTAVYYFFHEEGIDWPIFRRAFFEIAALRSPFTDPLYFNPPWVLPLLAPLALLPERLGAALVSALGISSIVYLCHKQGAKPLAILAIIFSPAMLAEARSSNITWLAALGLLLPPRWGLLIVLIKPQIGAGIAVYWVIDAWRKGGFKALITLLTPITVAGVASVVLFGFWPLRFRDATSLAWNFSYWQVLLPIGLILLVKSVRSCKPDLATACSPLLSPYIYVHTWLISLIALSSDTLLTLIAVAGLWVFFLVR